MCQRHKQRVDLNSLAFYLPKGELTYQSGTRTLLLADLEDSSKSNSSSFETHTQTNVYLLGTYLWFIFTFFLLILTCRTREILFQCRELGCW